MKQAIVTGATGFIGAPFVEYLIKKGVKVLALGRNELTSYSRSKQKKLRNASYLCINMAEIHFLEQKLSEIGWQVSEDCVFFNLAWGGVTNLSDLDVAAQVKNIAWSINALETSKRIGCIKFIQVGTMEEAFTEKYLDLDYTNNSEYNRHVVYSVAKISAKNALYLRANQIDMDLIYVLHSHVMGAEDDKDSFLQVTLQKLIRNDDLIFSSGEQYFDVISLEDCASGYYLICLNGKTNEEYWVGSGDPQPLRNYVERMEKLFPSTKKMQFGSLPYNDIKLTPHDFSITKLTEHTGYRPNDTYEDTVVRLHESLFNTKSD